MEDYNKIIESLGVRFIKAKNINILKPVTIENNYDIENSLILVNSGSLAFGKDKEVCKTGEVFFVPGGRQVSISYGTTPAVSLSKDDFLNNKEAYFQGYNDVSESTGESYSYVSFEAKAFDSVNFFASLDIPPFRIEDNGQMSLLIQSINKEVAESAPGKSRIIKVMTEQLVVELIRYILKQGLFVEQFATNSTYFKDPRLIDIFTFIKENLGEDLSNKVLANVANVSEDYVGQYFKMLTGINPQDYIEYQRMEEAVNLLRTSKKSIREIGKEVGYKDTAYFCRRFKMMFGIPAGKMRRRESLINV
ncbi:MAG: AraC family transcriptional regulator [Flammeovirgaceae bacterium]|nr:AraC family transcriptional regulator [Flammeovirgaceae bacterium]MBR07628.1 AraC family transcriptional regulator [Rickettsiales bacterium]HCX25196.1 AraC family transcriptional regulator [Cytophagales bacterium]